MTTDARNRTDRRRGAPPPTDRPPIRMAVPPVQPAAPDPLRPARRAFSRAGKEVTLSDETFHLAVFTVGGLDTVVEFLQDKYPPRMLAGEFSTGGEQIVEGMTQTRNPRPVQELLDLIIFEALQEPPAGPNVLDCDPDELVVALNLFFEHSGLRWLETTLMSLGSALREAFLGELKAQAKPMMAAIFSEARAKTEATTEAEDSTVEPWNTEPPGNAPITAENS